ncbi:hypothetical protein Hanom_Chr03g00212421 [Helianthus anomalus]
MIDYSFKICTDPANSCENGGMLSLEYNNTGSKVNKKANVYVDGDVPRSPCSSAIDIASSSNGEVKFTFSICFGDCSCLRVYPMKTAARISLVIALEKL